ncbi:MAG: type III secretion system inner membrane ring lipoprotein SctJ [Pseudochelatococcus sp.]|jgi:type III secretion protein J|uniref:type III secretion system inner membrane ring lipoprotein SctJ n=1 Tax=Pseudochelatococcus sp. TaxID=2020869 RepID=UPI003D90C896
MQGGWRRIALWFAVGLSLLLAGCSKSELYTGLAETEANKMLAELLTSGIAAEKVAVGKEGFAIRVGSQDVLRSLALLSSKGLPSVSHASINEVFQKSGIMSSPFEEKVRYVSTLGDEVARTLSFIDGVVTARVHIVQPDPPQMGKQPTPASAAVFIKHQAGVDLDFFVPQIRRLVSSSIEGLDYASVTVILSEAVPIKPETSTRLEATVELLPGIAVRETDADRFRLIFYALIGVVILLAAAVAAGAYLYLRGRTGKTADAVDAAPSSPLEPT